MSVPTHLPCDGCGQIASPEHIANILDASYRDTGLGVVAAAPASLAQGQSGATYSQEFGVIVG